jgi:indolepyruvate ferredoxin oxidoreductase beta subunit
VNQAVLRKTGVLIEPAQVQESELSNKKSMNVALLGVLSRYLEFPDGAWLAAIKRNLPESLYEANVQAFHLGKNR